MNSDMNIQYDPEWFKYVPDSWWFRPPETVIEESKALREKLNITESDSILDCPCGRADMSAFFANNGANIVGIDRNYRFILSARRKMLWSRGSARFYCMDMRRIQYRNRFDYVINWFNSFGYFSEDENIDVLKSFNLALKDGGRLVILGENISKMKHSYPRKEDLRDIFWDPENNCVGYVLSKRKKTIYGRAFFPTLDEYTALLKTAGFIVDATYDNYMNKFDENHSEWFVIIARKIHIDSDK